MRRVSCNFAGAQKHKCRKFILYSAIVSLLIGASADKVYGKEYTCLIHGAHKTKCNVWRSGNEVAIGGYQAAPIFKLIGNGMATDQRDEKYKVVNNNGSTIFSPLPGNSYSGVTIYGADIR